MKPVVPVSVAASMYSLLKSPVFMITSPASSVSAISPPLVVLPAIWFHPLGSVFGGAIVSVFTMSYSAW